MVHQKTDFSCGGVVWDEAAKKILLIRVENISGGQVWTFPKGHPETGESDRECALREVREETGWECHVIQQLNDVFYRYQHEDMLYNKTVRWFLMEPVNNSGKFDLEEVLEIRWATVEEATEMVSYGSDKELLKQTSLLL